MSNGTGTFIISTLDHRSPTGIETDGQSVSPTPFYRSQPVPFSLCWSNGYVQQRKSWHMARSPRPKPSLMKRCDQMLLTTRQCLQLSSLREKITTVFRHHRTATGVIGSKGWTHSRPGAVVDGISCEAGTKEQSTARPGMSLMSFWRALLSEWDGVWRKRTVVSTSWASWNHRRTTD